LKSYKKIIPALDAFPDAFICTADDEVYYWPTWLEELVRSANPHERVITCHRAHEIARTAQGAFASYRQWTYNTLFAGDQRTFFRQVQAASCTHPAHSPTREQTGTPPRFAARTMTIFGFTGWAVATARPIKLLDAGTDDPIDNPDHKEPKLN
jgi:hypothetical protein